MTSIVKYESMQDITESLAPFIAKTNQSVMVTEHDAINYLQYMREGLMKVGEMHAQAKFQESRAQLARERAVASLRLEKFPAWAAEHGIAKPTEKDKEAFICLQPEYEAAFNEEAYWEGVTKYLETVRSAFYTCIDDVKKNVYSRTHYNSMNVRA